MRPYSLLAVSGCYFLLGLYCLVSHFNWPAAVAVGVLHLAIFFAALEVSQEGYKPLLFFISFVFLGVMIFVAAWTWISWRAAWILRDNDRYAPYPLGLIGSVAWSMVSWAWTTYLSLNRARITRADQFLVLATPMMIAGILGVVHAATGDALVLRERLADFFHVATIGVASGVFLGLPWLCLPGDGSSEVGRSSGGS